ncbi:MAG: hypothetical protein NTZ25_02455 [Candidatus Peregrinibacteria bacterium]|nr:hypothetical protein [Candidatus Peregrinibacteria bacterium]
MARSPEDTNRDADEIAGKETGLQDLVSSAPDAANGQNLKIIPTLPEAPQSPSQRHAPTLVGYPTHPAFAPNPAFTPAPVAPSEAITDRFPVPATTTAAYSLSTPGTPAIGPFPSVDFADPLYTDYIHNPDAPRPTPFQQLRYTIAKKEAYSLDALSSSEFSTIFIAIFTERDRKGISNEEAEYLLEEYFETLPEKNCGDVFMDIIVAQDKELITKDEASRYATKLSLTDGDKAVFGDLYTNLTGESLFPSKRPAARKARLEDYGSNLEGLSGFSRFFSRKIAIAAGLVLATGATVGIGSRFGKADINLAPAPILTPAIPSNPDQVKAETQKAIFVKRDEPIPAPKPATPVVVKTETPSPKKVASIEAAPKVPAPVAAPTKKEEVPSLSLPVTTKTNSEGDVVVDEAKSITAWKKLGYSVGIQTRETGKVFTLTNKEGKKVIVNAQGLQKGQSVIEIK